MRISHEKEGAGVFWEKFEKYHGTFLFFHSQRGWVGGEFEKFRKVSIYSIKKVPAPPAKYIIIWDQFTKIN